MNQSQSLVRLWLWSLAEYLQMKSYQPSRSCQNCQYQKCPLHHFRYTK